MRLIKVLDMDYEDGSLLNVSDVQVMAGFHWKCVFIIDLGGVLKSRE